MSLLRAASARLTHRRAGTPPLPVYDPGVLEPLPGVTMPSARHIPSSEDGAVRGRPSRASSGGRRDASTTRPRDSHVPGASVRASCGDHATTSATQGATTATVLGSRPVLQLPERALPRCANSATSPWLSRRSSTGKGSASTAMSPTSGARVPAALLPRGGRLHRRCGPRGCGGAEC
jgi:hypothetical protein